MMTSYLAQVQVTRFYDIQNINGLVLDLYLIILCDRIDVARTHLRTSEKYHLSVKSKHIGAPLSINVCKAVSGSLRMKSRAF